MLNRSICASVVIFLFVASAWSHRPHDQSGGSDRKILLKLDGELTAEDPKSNGAYYKVHGVKLEAGTLYRIDLLGVARLDTYLRIRDGNGKVLAEDDDSGGNLNARIFFRPGKADTYQLVATTFEPAVTGKYVLLVSLADARDEKLAQRDGLWAAARASLEQGKTSDASRLVQNALALERELNGKLDANSAQLLSNLGAFLSTQGDYASARSYFEKALTITRDLRGENHRDTAISLNNLAVTLTYQGDYAGARPYQEQALAIIRKIRGNEHVDTAVALHNLGMVLCDQGDYPASRACYEESLAIRKKALPQNSLSTAGTLNNLGNVLEYLGDLPRALSLYQQALAIYRKVLGDGHLQTAMCLNNIGLVLTHQGEYAAARSHIEPALTIYKKELGDNHPKTCWSLNSMGFLLACQGDNTAANPYFHDALAISRKNLDLAATSQSERQQFRMAAQVRYRLDSFLAFATSAKSPPAELYAEVLASKGAITTRQHLLKQVLADPDLAPLATELQQIAIQLARESFATPDPKNRDAWLRRIEKLTADKERVERKLARQSSAFAKGLPEPGIEDLKKCLPASAALVDFVEYRHSSRNDKGMWTSESRLLAFVVRSKHDVVLVELGQTARIDAAIKDWRGDLKSISPGAGAKLRSLIWEPIENSLDGAETVLLSPDGSLHQVPFAALPGRFSGKYLVEERAIAIAPVPRWLMHPLEANVASGVPESTLLLVGDVDFAAATQRVQSSDKTAPAARAGLFKDWRPLPGTRGEIATIRDSFEQHFPDARVKILRGNGATESAVRQWAPKYQILHLATHGFFAPESVKSALAPPARGANGSMSLFDTDGISGFNPGLLSGIVLAGANRTPEPGQDDGILTALAVQQVDLRKVELVVLSACETGLGQVAGGEGILGLQRAFQVAGAKSVVASLWKVDDDATRKLMERFYDNLWQKKLSKMEALRQAQLAMLRGELVRGVEADGDTNRRLPPFYWAAFVLSGDWR